MTSSTKDICGVAILGVKDIASLMGVSVKTVYNRLSSGDGSFPQPVRIPHSKKLMWVEADVRHWIESHARRSCVHVHLQWIQSHGKWSASILKGGDLVDQVISDSQETVLNRIKEVMCE